MIERKEVITLLEVPSLAAGAKTELRDSKLLDLSKVQALTITAQVTHDAAATKPVVVKLYSDTTGGSPDTTEYAVFEAHLLTGQRSQKTVAITSDPKFIRVVVENTDTTYAARDIKVLATLAYESISRDYTTAKPGGD